MAPEQEARARAFYDHESDEPRRRRRAAADWGVNEDIFDRMPSRFARAERRGQHQQIVLRRDDADTSVAVIERGEDARVRSHERGRGDAERVRGGVTARAARDPRGRGDDVELDPRAAARAVMSWGDDLDDDAAPMVPGESRTIVLSRDDESLNGEALDDVRSGESRHAGRAYEALIADAPGRETGEFASLTAEPQERRTVKISGHPDRLPVPRTQRAPRTAVERIGHKPDRIVAYAVALGFLLVLIAVLTTGQ
jgi:hypothetical protein